MSFNFCNKKYLGGIIMELKLTKERLVRVEKAYSEKKMGTAE